MNTVRKIRRIFLLVIGVHWTITGVFCAIVLFAMNRLAQGRGGLSPSFEIAFAATGVVSALTGLGILITLLKAYNNVKLGYVVLAGISLMFGLAAYLLYTDADDIVSTNVIAILSLLVFFCVGYLYRKELQHLRKTRVETV